MRIPTKVTQTWWRTHEKVMYDWQVPLRLSVVRRALNPKLSKLSLEILSNHDFIERNHRIEKQNGRAQSFREIASMTAPDRAIIKSAEELHDYCLQSLDNCDRVIKSINDQWSDGVGIERYKDDDPNNFSEHSRRWYE